MNSNILVVDDDPITIRLLGHILSDLGTLRFATSGEDAVRLARESAPDLMLLDLKMPGMSGLRVCAAFKADPTLAGVPVLIVTSHAGAELEGILREMGAADFIAKPFDAPLIRARVESHLRGKRMNDELRSSDLIDLQTRVASRRRFDESLEQEWSRAQRAGTPLALLMIDVDHFQSFDERYGGPGGEACLQSVAQALTGVSRRPADLVARYGSDAFVVLLPHTPRGGAEHVAHEVVAAVAAVGIPRDASSVLPGITVSVGVACYEEAGDSCIPPSGNVRDDVQPQALCSAIDLVRAADRALSSAKNAGGNQAKLMDIVDVAASPAH